MQIYTSPITVNRKMHSYGAKHQEITKSFARVHARQLRWTYRRLRETMPASTARSIIFDLLSIGQWMQTGYLTPEDTSL
jgi:hypothetical protein